MGDEVEKQREVFLNVLDLEVEEKARIMELLTKCQIVGLRTTLHCELMRLPKEVRQMAVGELVDNYGGDIQAACRVFAKKGKRE